MTNTPHSQMKKVVFLGDTLNTEEPLGIQRYASEILRSLDTMELKYKCEVVIPSSDESHLYFEQIQVKQYGPKESNGFKWRQCYFPKYVKTQKAIGVDLTLGLCVLGTDVVCLHDCIHENYPDDFVGLKQKIKRYSYLLRSKRAIKNARRVITVSIFSKKEIEEHYGIKNVAVVYDAWQHYERITSDNSILDKLDLRDKQFYFSLGSKLPHKNFKWIEEAARQNPVSVFVVTGTKRFEKNSEKRELPNIIYTGFLNDSQVKALMENCKAFIHPSLYEGFGIPPLEALASGAQILISKSTCLPEIYGASANYFDAGNYEHINIEQLMKGSISEVEISRTLERYSWEESARRLDEILNEL